MPPATLGRKMPTAKLPAAKRRLGSPRMAGKRIDTDSQSHPIRVNRVRRSGEQGLLGPSLWQSASKIFQVGDRHRSMLTPRKSYWEAFERWSPRLFILAAVFLLVGAANSGLAFLGEDYAFDAWGGVILELGRIAALLGTAGLSAGIVTRSARLGALARAVPSLAVAFVTALTAMVVLTVAGVLVEPVGIVGLLAYVLSVSSFLLVGAAIVRTGAYAGRVGGFLLLNVLALLVVFFGRLFVPLNLVATVIPSLQVLLYIGVAYSLRESVVAAGQTAPTTTDTVP